jgi:hypothetical protein
LDVCADAGLTLAADYAAKNGRYSGDVRLKGMKVITALLVALALAADPKPVTVHEWGTFTTVAGPDGHAIDWLPLGGPIDLPCFVDRFDKFLKYSPPLKAKVRMETPVLYFYSPQTTTLNVRVDFPGGIVTEWYPQAKVSPLSRIEWNNVKVLPGTQPSLLFEDRPSHYYAARDTDADPVQVNGKNEKFLFYRGVGSFPVPLSAKVTSKGQILVSAVTGETIPAIVLFENRGGKIGYRAQRNFGGEALLDLPALDAEVASLRQDLEMILIAQGLYAKEARAMIETWRDSWFEEGTRVFYVVPSKVVDAILPLKIDPKPAEVARAFVGRMEVITAATVKTVEDAIAANDKATLAKHGRLLGPIADRMARTPDVRAAVDAAYRSFVGAVSSACK